MEKRPRPGLAQEYIGLKLMILLLPVSLLLFYWHQHRSIALALGLGLGVGLSQVVPPRKPAWQVLLWIMCAVFLELATSDISSLELVASKSRQRSSSSENPYRAGWLGGPHLKFGCPIFATISSSLRWVSSVRQDRTCRISSEPIAQSRSARSPEIQKPG
jgi:hypothetical protein